MAENREIFAIESQSQSRLGGLGADRKQLGALADHQILDMVAARSTLEFATERTERRLGTGATAPGSGLDVSLANRVAAAQDHADPVALMRGARKNVS